MVRARASKSLTVKFLILLWKFVGEELEMVAARHGSISQIGLCNERRDATNTRKSRPRHTHYRLNITTYNKADSNVCPVRDIAFRTRLTRRAIAAPNCTETRPLALATMARAHAVDARG